MRPPLSKVPALPAAAGIVVGILIFHSGLQLAGVFIAIALFFVAFWLDRHFCAFFVIMTGIGIMLAYVHQPAHLPDQLLDRSLPVKGELVSKSVFDRSISLTLKIDSINQQKTPPILCQLTLFTAIDTLPTGTKILADLSISKLYSSAGLPHQGDFAKYLINQGILYTASTNPTNIHVVSGPSQFYRFIAHAQSQLRDAIYSSHVSDETADFLIAIIVGDKTIINDGAKSAFRSIGIAHVLALSGMHVGILASIVSLLLLPLRLFRNGNVFKAMVLLSVIWLYALICGMGASLVRASVMITVVTLVWFLQRGYAVVNSLLLSVIIILMIDPYSLFMPGFQLSVAAVLSIIIFGKVIPDSWRRRPILFFLANMVVVPIAAMVGTGLVSAYYFYSFPPMFLISNIITGLLFPWIYTGGVIVALLGLLGFNPHLLCKCVDMLYNLFIQLTTLVVNGGAGEVRGLCFSPWAFVPYAAAFAALAMAIRLHRRYLYYLAGAMVCATAITISLTTEAKPTAELFVDKSTYGTNLIYRYDDTAWFVPVTLRNDPPQNVKSACEKLYRSYLVARNCPDTFRLAYNEFTSPQFIVKWPYIFTPGHTLYVVTGDSLYISPSVKVHYVLLGKNYSGSIHQIITVIHPDTILLAADMHPKRRYKLKSEIADAPVRDLFSGNFALTWP